MGLLDQAIREHLALKRQHGADPGELARLEREALGPPVRETQEVLAAAAPARGAARQADSGEPELEPWPEEPGAQAVPPPTTPFDVEQAMANEGGDATAPAEAAPTGDRTHATAPHAEAELTGTPEKAGGAAEPPEPELAEPPEPELAEPPEPEPTEPTEPAPAELADEPERPAHGDAEAAESEAEGDEDVLEETPEFLQETPEHDRLWFEQKPPRDFDFDG